MNKYFKIVEKISQRKSHTGIYCDHTKTDISSKQQSYGELDSVSLELFFTIEELIMRPECPAMLIMTLVLEISLIEYKIREDERWINDNLITYQTTGKHDIPVENTPDVPINAMTKL